MDLDHGGADKDRHHAHPAVPRAFERVLRTTIPIADVRLADVIALPIAMVVAVVVCIPILMLTLLVGYGLGFAFGALGLPPAGQGLVILVVGLGGGLAIGFAVLLRILRRLPRSVRRIAFELDDTSSEPSPPPPAPVARMTADELRAVDAGLAATASGRDEDAEGRGILGR